MSQYTEQFIEYRNSILYYYIAGSGPEALVAFHGFGQDHRAFDAWVQTMSKKYTFYLFDLYFHGASRWPIDGESLDPSDWKEIFSIFLRQQTIEKLSIAGFSLGGKFALATVMTFPENIDRLFLIAPDGIKVNFWYRLATYPWLLRKIFSSMIRHGRIFQYTLHTAVRFRLVDRWLSRFAENQMDTEEKRRRVYGSWVAFRHLNTDMRNLEGTIRKHGINLTLITGKFDRVITTRQMSPLIDRFSPLVLVELDSGHNQLILEAMPLLMHNEFTKKV